MEWIRGLMTIMNCKVITQESIRKSWSYSVSESREVSISPPGSPGQGPMDTLPPAAVHQVPPPPPPAVEKISVSVGTDVDLEGLYTPEIAPGILPVTLPWGVTIKDIVQALLDHPTLHVDDILLEMLLHPRYPGTTMREFQALSTIARTAQVVLREVGQRCVTSMLPVRLIQDRNDPTQGQVEDSITGMLGAQAARTDQCLPWWTWPACEARSTHRS